MAEEQNSTPSHASSKGLRSIDPPEYVVNHPPPIRRNSSAMLSRKHTFPATGRLLGRRWRRHWRPRRRHPDHPAVTGTGKPETLPRDEGAPVSRGAPVTCSVDSIMRKITAKKKPQRKYPEFDSLSAYAVSDRTAENLRRAETERLLAFIEEPDRPLALGSTVLFSNTEGDENGYRKLSRLSNSISTALSLCLLDNECINVEFCSRLANRERLQKLVQQARTAAKSTRPTAHDAEVDVDDDPLEHKLEAMFELVNYMSAILARLISQTAMGDYWLTNVMAVLVARVTKIKVLLMNLALSATVAADAGEEALEKTRESGDFAASLADEEEECEEALRIIDANAKEGLTSEEETDVGSYCVNQNKFRSGINASLKYILLSLRLMNRSGLPPTMYEMCVVVYEIGFEGFRTVLFQDRDLEYSASSDRVILNTAQPALLILDQTLRHLKGKIPHREKGLENGLETLVEWAYLEKAPDGSPCSHASGVDYYELSRSMRSVRLGCMADIITAMVPLITTSPIFLSNFSNFRTMIALTGGVEDVVRPFAEGQFGAFCRLYTNQFEPEADGREILRLSEAFREQRFSRCRLLTEGKSKWGAKIWNHHHQSHAPASAREPRQETQERLDEHAEDMQEWVVDETSVTISCRFYVWSIMSVAGMLGGGGLAIGFTLGNRVEGVDPFNLATYTWVLAAFVILICKSILVEHWTWSDFLRCRVRCRSVSELAAATGIDEQLVMAKLLHDDCGGTILVTRGPYNSVFRRRAKDGGDGFSIDRPMSAETLMLSGLAPLKVVTPRGHAIVCLDYRRGTTLVVVEHQGRQDNARLVCEDLGRVLPRDKKHIPAADGGWKTGPAPVRLRLAEVENFKWKRVQGLYAFNGVDIVFE